MASVSSSVGMKAAFGVDEYLPFPMRESFPFLVSWPKCHSSVDREDSTFSGVAESRSATEKTGFAAA